MAVAAPELERAPAKTATGAPADALERWYLALTLGLTLIVWAGLVLAEWGLFSRAAVVGMIVVVAGGLTALACRSARTSLPVSSRDGPHPLAPSGRASPPAYPPLSPLVGERGRGIGGAAVCLAGILAVGAALTLPPFEFTLGGLDPGVYVNTGVTINKTGGIRFWDTEMASLEPALRTAWLSEDLNRLPGFYIVDLVGLAPKREEVSTGLVTPHGFHLYPAALAVGYALGGLRAELLVTPLLALLGLAGLFLLVRRLLNLATAAIATFLLAINLGQVWFARYPAAEILVQLLLFAGLLAFVLMLDTNRRFDAVAAGVLLGAVHLAKIEALFLPLVLAAFFAHEWLRRRFRRERLYFIVPYGLLLLHAVLHAAFVSTIYSYNVAVAAFPFRSPVWPVLAVVLAAGLVVGRKALGDLLEALDLRPLVTLALVLGVSVLALYAYYVRPLGTAAILADRPEALWEVASVQSFIRLGWYVPPLGLLLGTLGWLLLLADRRSLRTGVFFALVALDVVYLLSDPKITPIHFWAARRWVPLVIPGFLLGVAYFLTWLARRGWPDWRAVLAACACGLIVVAGSLNADWPFFGHVEYGGAGPQLAAIAERLPATGVALFDDDDFGWRLSTPLHYVWDRTSFILWRRTSSPEVVRALVDGWQRQGKEVYWVRANNPQPPSAPGYRVEPVVTLPFDVPIARITTDRRPDFVERFRLSLQLFRLVPDSGLR